MVRTDCGRALDSVHFLASIPDAGGQIMPAAIRNLLILATLLLAFPSTTHARWYDPATGRWLQRDPLGSPGQQLGTQTAQFRSAAPSLAYHDGANTYQYVRGRAPVMADPMGLCGGSQPCPPFPAPDLSIPIEKYNCAGLAFRTYTFIGDVKETRRRLTSAGRELANCSEKCKPCELKCRLWEYSIEIRTLVQIPLPPGVAGPPSSGLQERLACRHAAL
jgi:RHS repeat-associated protein